MSSEITEIWEQNIDKKEAEIRANRVLDSIRKYHPDADSVLELGVGLGVVLVHFKDFEQYGLDLHEEFIDSARKFLPDADLTVQSMDSFAYSRTFDIIFSVHECINEVKPFDNWKATFSQTKKHLNKDGLFIFDMRTMKHLEDMKNSVVKLEKKPSGYMYDNKIVDGNKLTWDTTYFTHVKDDLYRLEKDTYNELIYPVEEVERTLEQNFTILETVYFDDERKVMFVCQKDK